MHGGSVRYFILGLHDSHFASKSTIVPAAIVAQTITRGRSPLKLGWEWPCYQSPFSFHATGPRQSLGVTVDGPSATQHECDPSTAVTQNDPVWPENPTLAFHFP